MSLILVVLILRFIGKLRSPQIESISINNFQRIRHSPVFSFCYGTHMVGARKFFKIEVLRRLDNAIMNLFFATDSFCSSFKQNLQKVRRLKNAIFRLDFQI